MAEDGDVEIRARVRSAILDHLRRNPCAGDTADGILACWLTPLPIGEAARVIDEVIDAMVAAGELVARQLPDGHWFYRRPHQP